jgi:hypothetical protein
MAQPPLIVIGMHRSGTTLVAGLLARAGIYMGRRLGRNHEALHFRHLNRWLLAQGGGSWARPLGFTDVLADPPARALAADYLRASLQPPRAAGFWGARGLAATPAGPWGWKDPRTTFTLPLWLELFPEARIIHVERHGMDVAESLVTRRERALARSQARFNRRRWLYRLVAKRGELLDTPRLANREGALALWAEYIAEGRRQTEALGGQALSLRYETLLQQPERELARLADFSGLSLDAGSAGRLVSDLDPARAFAYQRDPALQRLAADHSDVLERFGYRP